jgi:hypothetical protein
MNRSRNCSVYIDYIKRTDPTGSHYEFGTDLIGAVRNAVGIW